MAKKRTRSQRRNRRRREARRDEKRRDPTRRVEACIDETCVVCLEHADAYPKSYDCPQCSKRVCASCLLKMLQLRATEDHPTIIGFPCAVCRNWIDLADKPGLASGGPTPLKPLMTAGCPQNFLVFDCCKQNDCSRRVLLHHHACDDGCYSCSNATIEMVRLA